MSKPFIEDVHRPKGTFRLVMICAALLVVALPLLPVQWLACRFHWKMRRHLPVFFHRIALKFMDVRVHVKGQPTRERPALILSNHVSWIDIIALSTLMPMSFVAKAEIATWPIFGTLARLQRSVFVDRQKRGDTARVNAEIAERLAEGDPIVLFAESTTSDGNRILPFRSALVGAAHQALTAGASDDCVWLQPVALAYNGADGLPTGRTGRARIGWYGDMEMLPHLKNILKGGALDVTIAFAPAIPCHTDSDRKGLTLQAEVAVRRMLTEELTGRVAPLV
jgi:lyso-ornithine lipid O-acyltransferase